MFFIPLLVIKNYSIFSHFKIFLQTEEPKLRVIDVMRKNLVQRRIEKEQEEAQREMFAPRICDKSRSIAIQKQIGREPFEKRLAIDDIRERDSQMRKKIQDKIQSIEKETEKITSLEHQEFLQRQQKFLEHKQRKIEKTKLILSPKKVYFTWLFFMFSCLAKKKS